MTEETGRPDVLLWFSNLSLDARVALLENPEGGVPTRHLEEVVRYHSVAGAYWPSIQEGPTGFYLAGEVAEALGRHRASIESWWDSLDGAARAAFIEHRNDEVPAEFQNDGLGAVGGILRHVDVSVTPDFDGDFSALSFTLSSSIAGAWLELQARKTAD